MAVGGAPDDEGAHEGPAHAAGSPITTTAKVFHDELCPCLAAVAG